MIKYLFILLLLISCARQKKSATVEQPVTYDTVSQVEALEGVESVDMVGEGKAGGVPGSRDYDPPKKSTPPVYMDMSKEADPVFVSPDKPKTGNLVYDIPDTMKYMNIYQVVVRIDRTPKKEFVFEGLTDPVEATIRTSDVMEVELIDPTEKSFSIVRINNPQQIVDTIDYTQWVFDVVPLRSGSLKLKVVVSIISNGNKKQVVYSDDVTVTSNIVALAKVQTKTFFEKHWKWVMTVIVIPFVIWFYNSKKKKNDK